MPTEDDPMKRSTLGPAPCEGGIGLQSRKTLENARSPFDFSTLDDLLINGPPENIVSSPTVVSLHELPISNPPTRGTDLAPILSRSLVSAELKYRSAYSSCSPTLPPEKLASSNTVQQQSTVKFPASSYHFGRLKNLGIFERKSFDLESSPRQHTFSDPCTSFHLNGADSSILSAEAYYHADQSHLEGCGSDDRKTPGRLSFWSSSHHSIIHAHTFSGLPRPGQTFTELFRTDFSPLSSVDEVTHRKNSLHDDGADLGSPTDTLPAFRPEMTGDVTPATSPSSRASMDVLSAGSQSKNSKVSGIKGRTESSSSKKQRQSLLSLRVCRSPSPGIWWLHVNSPTKEEMSLIRRTFLIHPLTIESIASQEPREKVDVFRHYYFVCYKSIDPNPTNPTNVYILVFREGIITLQFRPTSHPANVRRRIHNLKDHINLTTDWICYALIDDMTGFYSTMISRMEVEIDELERSNMLSSKAGVFATVVRCRQQVIAFARLLKNKHAVVRALSKRCSENATYLLTPDSDIGLYLSDVQDHLTNMTQNLDHYERILSRCHSDYLAHLSIEIASSGSRVNQLLGKFTVMGSIVMPMNLICTVWGMNIVVPGQSDLPDLTCFYVIISSSLALGIFGVFFMKRYYKMEGVI